MSMTEDWRAERWGTDDRREYERWREKQENDDDDGDE